MTFPLSVPPTAHGAVRVEPGQSLALGEHPLVVGSACVTKFGIVWALGRYRRVRVGLWQSCGSLNCIEEDVSPLRALGLLSVPATILLAFLTPVQAPRH